MNTVIGVACLVAMAVTTGATGSPEQQQLDIEDEIATEDHLERKGRGCRTKNPCRIVGGRCQSLKDDCDGVMKEARFYCTNYKKCGCCIPKGCVYGNKAYRVGSTIDVSCFMLQCIKGGVWNYTGKINKICGECQVFGDPQFLTFDNHTNAYPANWYSYNDQEGNFTVTQSGLEYLTKLSVTSFFESNPEYPAGDDGYTAARTVCYWEPEITVCVLLPSFELGQCYSSSEQNDQDCAIKVTVNGYPYEIGKDVKVFQALAGDVLVFNHNHHGIIIDPYDNDGTNANNSQCINVVGSMGLSVSLCTSYNDLYGEAKFSLYSNLYVWATPCLKGQLYGMCDTYTGETQNGYTMQNGTMTNDIAEFALSWMISGTSVDRPDVNRCTNQTVLDQVEGQCASITKGVCESSPTKCAGFISACEFDLCRVSNPDDYAQGYANHFKIETHLNQ